MEAPEDRAEEGECGCLYLILGVLGALCLLVKLARATQGRWFAWVMHFCTKDIFLPLEEVKKEFFGSMSSCVSHDPELKKKKAIRILEIGVGTGVNFAHYPPGSHLVVVDPNPNFKKYYEDNKTKFPDIEAEEIIIATGDKMDVVKDSSVDVVVVTLVLCSVDKVEETLKEILRVLTPGGKFYFMEHIAEFDLKKHWLRRKLQHVLTHWIPVWPIVFDGCCLDRDTLPAIQKAGFSSVHAQKYYAPVPNFLFEVESPNLKGIATK